MDTTVIVSTEHMFIADPTVFTVEELLRKRKRHGSFEYLVKWRDYNFKYNTWEPESNILDQRLVEEFNQKCSESPQLFDEGDEYDSDMSNAEESRSSKRKRVTRSSQKLRRRSKRVGKYEEVEQEVEERVSDMEEEGEIKVEKKKRGAQIKETSTPPQPSKEDGVVIEEDEAPSDEHEHVEDDKSLAKPCSPSNMRNLRNKNISTSYLASKRRSSSSKFSDLMKRSRQQASTYRRHFVSKPPHTSPVSAPAPSSAKLSSEEEEDQDGSDDATDSSKKASPTNRSIRVPKKLSPPPQEEEQQVPLSGREKYRKKCAEMTPDQVLVERAKARERMRVYREKKMKGGTPDLGDEPITTSSKQKQRKRPVRSCAVPTGFWDPVVLKPEASNSTVQIDGEEKAEEEEEEEVFRARPRMKNHEPAPPSFYSCYSEDTDAPSNGCINDLGESVFPRKKFTLKPPILDISKRPISDFVFKIEDLWADKIHECSVEALGYSVKIYECKSAKPLFTKTDKKSEEQLDT